ncbi:MAG: hypothetical protein ABIJ34_05750 [archaeon]
MVDTLAEIVKNELDRRVKLNQGDRGFPDQKLEGSAAYAIYHSFDQLYTTPEAQQGEFWTRHGASEEDSLVSMLIEDELDNTIPSNLKLQSLFSQDYEIVSALSRHPKLFPIIQNELQQYKDTKLIDAVEEGFRKLAVRNHAERQAILERRWSSFEALTRESGEVLFPNSQGLRIQQTAANQPLIVSGDVGRGRYLWVMTLDNNVDVEKPPYVDESRDWGSFRFQMEDKSIRNLPTLLRNITRSFMRIALGNSFAPHTYRFDRLESSLKIDVKESNGENTLIVPFGRLYEDEKPIGLIMGRGRPKAIFAETPYVNAADNISYVMTFGLNINDILARYSGQKEVAFGVKPYLTSKSVSGLVAITVDDDASVEILKPGQETVVSMDKVYLRSDNLSMRVEGIGTKVSAEILGMFAGVGGAILLKEYLPQVTGHMIYMIASMAVLGGFTSTAISVEKNNNLKKGDQIKNNIFAGIYGSVIGGSIGALMSADSAWTLAAISSLTASYATFKYTDGRDRRFRAAATLTAAIIGGVTGYFGEAAISPALDLLEGAAAGDTVGRLFTAIGSNYTNQDRWDRVATAMRLYDDTLEKVIVRNDSSTVEGYLIRN